MDTIMTRASSDAAYCPSVLENDRLGLARRPRLKDNLPPSMYALTLMHASLEAPSKADAPEGAPLCCGDGTGQSHTL